MHRGGDGGYNNNWRPRQPRPPRYFNSGGNQLNYQRNVDWSWGGQEVGRGVDPYATPRWPQNDQHDYNYSYNNRNHPTLMNLPQTESLLGSYNNFNSMSYPPQPQQQPLMPLVTDFSQPVATHSSHVCVNPIEEEQQSVQVKLEQELRPINIIKTEMKLESMSAVQQQQQDGNAAGLIQGRPSCMLTPPPDDTDHNGHQETSTHEDTNPPSPSHSHQRTRKRKRKRKKRKKKSSSSRHRHAKRSGNRSGENCNSDSDETHDRLSEVTEGNGGGMEIVIVTATGNPYRDVTQWELARFCRLAHQRILDTVSSGGVSGLAIQDVQLIDGKIQVECTNSQTASWLRTIFQRGGPSSGANSSRGGYTEFFAWPQGEEPNRLTRLKTYRCWVSNHFDVDGERTVPTRLEFLLAIGRQNGFSTAGWRVFAVNPGHGGNTFILGIPEEHVSLVEASDGWLFYGIGRVHAILREFKWERRTGRAH